MHTKFWSKNLKGRDHSEDTDVDWNNIKMVIRDIRWEGVNRMHLAQDRDPLTVI